MKEKKTWNGSRESLNGGKEEVEFKQEGFYRWKRSVRMGAGGVE